MSEKTPEECYAKLRPILDDISRMVATAPIEDEKKCVLAVMVAIHSFGTALAAYGCDVESESDLRVVTDVIIKAMTQRSRH